jgi:diacylglycerol kinase (ATP)
MQILVIGNPIAGAGRAERIIRKFTRKLEHRGHRVQIFMTARSGDAFKRARAVRGGLDRLVIAGGDGTVNEVINGLADPSRIPILHLPTGTANQLARSLRLPFDPEQLVLLTEQGAIRRIDMGLAGNRRFLLLVSAGFDARVVEEVKKHRGNTLGYSGYLFPILKAISSHRPVQLEVIIDNEQRIAGCNVMVLKVREYGGVFVFAEEARLDSGRFEVCVFQQGSPGWMSLYAVAGLIRKAADVPGVIRLTARTVRIESEEPMPVEIDGDHFGMTPVDVSIHEAVVPVVVPNSLC